MGNSKNKTINIELPEDLVGKYESNKVLCNKKIKDAIKSALRESELKKLLDEDRQNKHGVFEKLNVNLSFIIEHLNILYDYVAAQRPSLLKALGQPGDSTNKFLIVVQSIWIHNLCLINQIREMLLIDITSSNFNDIIYNNPFIIWDKQFLKARHYKHKAVCLQTKANEIYEKINKEALRSYAQPYTSPFGKTGEHLVKAFYKYKDEMEENEADTVVEIFNVNKETAKKILSLMRSYRIEFLLPAISNFKEEIIDKILARILKLRTFFWCLMTQINGAGGLDDLLSHKNELWKWINDSLKIEVRLDWNITRSRRKEK